MARSIILASSLLTVEVTTLSGPSSLRLAAVFGDHDALITDVAASICACVGNQQLPSSSPIIFSLICVKSSIGGFAPSLQILCQTRQEKSRKKVVRGLLSWWTRCIIRLSSRKSCGKRHRGGAGERLGAREPDTTKRRGHGPCRVSSRKRKSRTTRN